MKKRICGLVLALCVAAMLLPVGALADEFDQVSYLDANGKQRTINTWPVPQTLRPVLENGWYVVFGNMTLRGSLRVSGNAHLILANGCTLNAPEGIEVEAGNSLTIYAQSTGDQMGVLNASNKSGPAIGSRSVMGSGTITINGGNITAHCEPQGSVGAGIGGGSLAGCTVVINGGIVDAIGANNSPGIGGGRCDGKEITTPVNVTINGGTVTATGRGGAPGIGGGNVCYYTAINVTISGGIVTATGSEQNGHYAGGIGDGVFSNFSTFNFSTGHNGTACIFAYSGGNKAIDDSSYQTDGQTRGIIYENNNGVVYSSSTYIFTLSQNFTNKPNHTLTIPHSTTLFIPTGITLTNYGKITGDGTIDGAGKIVTSVAAQTLPAARTGLIYNGTPQALITPGTASGINMQYRLGEDGGWSADIPAATDAKSDYKVYYKAVGGGTHLDSGERFVTVAIAKATPTIVTPPQAKTGLTYTGDPQELVTAGKTCCGEIQYSLSENDGYSAALPEGVEANDYHVWYRVAENDNYYGIAPASVPVSISPKVVANPTISITPDSYAFTSSAIIPNSVVVKDGDDIIPASEYTLSYENNVNVGTEAKVIVTDRANGNYTVSGSKRFTIAYAVYDITVADNGGGTASVSTSSAAEGALITLSAAPKTGYRFKGWRVLSGNVTITDNQFYMPAEPVSLQAVFDSIIDQQPTDQSVEEGQQATFSLSAPGAGFTFQWYINRGDGLGWLPLDGKTAASYTTAVTTLTNNGFRYFCRMTDAHGQTLDSAVATLRVSKKVVPPQTGDRFAPLLWLGLCLLGGAGALALLRKRRT